MKDDDGETVLVRSSAEGDKEAFRKLVEKHQNLVYSTIFRQVREHDLCEDLTQDTFMKAFRKIDTFKFRAGFSTWLTRIALNVCLNFFESSLAKRSSVTDSYDETLHENAVRRESFSTVQAEQRVIALEECMSKLTPRYRQIVDLCSVARHSYQSAADLLEVPLGTVASRMNMAYRLLRECISRRLTSEG